MLRTRRWAGTRLGALREWWEVWPGSLGMGLLAMLGRTGPTGVDPLQAGWIYIGLAVSVAVFGAALTRPVVLTGRCSCDAPELKPAR